MVRLGRVARLEKTREDRLLPSLAIFIVRLQAEKQISARIETLAIDQGHVNLREKPETQSQACRDQ